MKITATQHAKALYEATKGKSHQKIDEAVVNFGKILSGNNQLRLGKDIIKKFSDICNSENNIVEAEIVSRDRLVPELVEKVIRFIKKRYNAREVIIQNRIDKSIKGGIIIKIRDEVIDGSMERKLKELKNKLIS